MPPPLRDFRVAVRAAILSLPEAPTGFTFDELADRLGAPYRVEGADRTRLRRWITNHVSTPRLTRLGRGRYAPGPELAEHDALGVGAQLVPDIRQAFDDAGGVLMFKELLIELDREDGTLVRRILDDSSIYVSGTPFPGFRRAWYLADAERLTLPLPGHLMGFDIHMSAGGPRPDLPHLLRRRRTQIAAALAEAREFAQMTIPEVAAVPAVANTLDAALRRADVLIYDEEGEADSLAARWSAIVRTLGRPDALVEAWRRLETGEEPHLIATSVKFWRAVGTALGFSAAHLSRGCVARLR